MVKKYYFCRMTDIPKVIHLTGNDNIILLSELTDHKSGMLLCLEGYMHFVYGGVSCRATAGDMLIVVPFSNMSITELSKEFRGILCSVEMEFVFSAIKAVSLGANYQFITMHPLSHPSEADTAAMLSLISTIEDRAREVDSRPLASLTLDSLWHALAYLILDSYMNVRQLETQGRGIKETILANFQANLSRDFITHRNVAYYASLQNLSPRYFSTVIKEISGQTPLHWISVAVVTEAKRMMRDSNKSIKEIGYELNFTTPTFFTRWFRHFTGESPSSYRKRSRITLSPEEE